MQTLPICRLTSAAWELTPPTAVRMPRAAFMPRRSSGVVSLRTRISAAAGLACLIASAFCGEQTILPVAAPGPAGMPLVSSLSDRGRGLLRLDVEERLKQLAQVAGRDVFRRNRLVLA